MEQSSNHERDPHTRTTPTDRAPAAHPGRSGRHNRALHGTPLPQPNRAAGRRARWHDRVLQGLAEDRDMEEEFRAGGGHPTVRFADRGDTEMGEGEPEYVETGCCTGGVSVGFCCDCVSDDW